MTAEFRLLPLFCWDG